MSADSKVAAIFEAIGSGATTLAGVTGGHYGAIPMTTIIPLAIGAVGLLGGASSRSGLLSKLWGGGKGAVVWGLMGLIAVHALNWAMGDISRGPPAPGRDDDAFDPNQYQLDT